jgi:hypothetical protein
MSERRGRMSHNFAFCDVAFFSSFDGESLETKNFEKKQCRNNVKIVRGFARQSLQ